MELPIGFYTFNTEHIFMHLSITKTKPKNNHSRVRTRNPINFVFSFITQEKLQLINTMDLSSEFFSENVPTSCLSHDIHRLPELSGNTCFPIPNYFLLFPLDLKWPRPPHTLYRHTAQCRFPGPTSDFYA